MRGQVLAVVGPCILSEGMEQYLVYGCLVVDRWAQGSCCATGVQLLLHTGCSCNAWAATAHLVGSYCCGMSWVWHVLGSCCVTYTIA
jgi:hypothetical protein